MIDVFQDQTYALDLKIHQLAAPVMEIEELPLCSRKIKGNNYITKAWPGWVGAGWLVGNCDNSLFSLFLDTQWREFSADVF